MEIEGIMPALHTNYDEQGEVSTNGLDEQLSFLLEAGCSGFFVGGSTGEGILQTVDERRRYMEAVVKSVSGRAPVIAHVGALATRDACELARHAERIGADAVGSVMPIYYPIGIDAAVEHYRTIAAASELPLLIYYLELAASEPLTAQVFAERFATIPHVCALKYTSPNLETFGRIVTLCGEKLSVIMGCDQTLLPALTLGARGAIGTTYNFMPELAVGVYRHYRAGELAEAQALMALLFRVIYLIKRTCPPSSAASREIMRMRGMETGRCRAPLPNLTREHVARLREGLEELDFFSALKSNRDK